MNRDFEWTPLESMGTPASKSSVAGLLSWEFSNFAPIGPQT